MPKTTATKTIKDLADAHARYWTSYPGEQLDTQQFILKLLTLISECVGEEEIDNHFNYKTYKFEDDTEAKIVNAERNRINSAIKQRSEIE